MPGKSSPVATEDLKDEITHIVWRMNGLSIGGAILYDSLHS